MACVIWRINENETKHQNNRHLEHRTTVQLNARVLVVVTLLQREPGQTFSQKQVKHVEFNLLKLVRAPQRAGIVVAPLSEIHAKSVTRGNVMLGAQCALRVGEA